MANTTTNTALASNTSSKSYPGKLDGFCRNSVLKILSHLQVGSLTIVDPIETLQFIGPQPGPVAKIEIKDFEAYRDIALQGSIGAAESYMTGDWTTPNLTNVVRVMTLNLPLLESMESGLTKLLMPLMRFTHWLNRNTTKGAQRNIAAHYDLGNEFFELFLDPTMTYSSGIFPTENSSMKEASLNKMTIICEKLQLQPQDHVLEIGTGWGSMAIFMAEQYGCHVTTTTISKEQHQYAAQRIKQKGLEHKITLLLVDYRDLQGLEPDKQYDKVVSVEMIEAVGHQFYNQYFATINDLLKPRGLALIQAITIEDQRYELAKKRVDFIQKYIFPGSCIPCISAINTAVKEATQLRPIHQVDFAAHYARTLNCWHHQLIKNWDSIRSKGYDDTFLRMWQFYLSYCEGGFKERAIGVSHLLFAKTLNRTTLNCGA